MIRFLLLWAAITAMAYLFIYIAIADMVALVLSALLNVGK